MTTRPLLIIGAGGHAAVVLDAATRAGLPVEGLVDADPARHGSRVLGVSVLGGDEVVLERDPAAILLVLGIGSTDRTDGRRAIFERFRDRGYAFGTVVHPSAVVADSVELGAGCVVMAGAVIQPRCRLGDDVIVNTGARIDHDGRVGDHAHIAPGAVLCGDVRVGPGAHVGAGATVIQGIGIGRDAFCAAGSVVVGAVRDGARVAGIPAKEMG